MTTESDYSCSLEGRKGVTGMEGVALKKQCREAEESTSICTVQWRTRQCESKQV